MSCDRECIHLIVLSLTYARSLLSDGAGNLHAKAGSTISLTSLNPSILGTLNGGPGSDGKGGASQLSRQLTTSAKDPRTRAKSREYLKQ